MKPDDSNRRELKKRRLPFVLALLVCLGVTLLLGLKGFFPSHPKFGAIYEATAFDLHEARYNRFAVFLRDHLPRRVVQSPHFPDRFKDQPRYLQLRNTQAEWSIGGTNAGWLYFWGINPNRSLVRSLLPDKWQFAPCAERELLNVTKVPLDFYGASDLRIREVFGGSSTTNAINVSVGQILFARRTDETNCTYILKFKEQYKNKLVVHYCVSIRK